MPSGARRRLALARAVSAAAALAGAAAGSPSDGAWQCLWAENYSCKAAPPGEPGAYPSEAACRAACRAPQPVPDPLQRWLHDLTFTIPRFTVNRSGIALGLGPLRCTHMGVGSFSTSRVAAAASASLSVDLLGITADCAGDFDVALSSMRGAGTVALGLGASSYLGLNVVLSGGRPPVAADITCRRSALNVTGPVFGPADSAVAKALNAERGLVSALLEGAWPGLVCPMLSNFARTELSPILALIAAEMRILTPTPPAPPQPLTPGSIDLSKAGWPRFAAWMVGEVLGEPALPPYPGLNWLMDRATHDTGGYTLGLQLELPQVAVPLAGGASVDVSINGLTLRGLDSFKHFDPLQLSSAAPHALGGRIGLGNLSATLYLSVVSQAADGTRSANAQSMAFQLDLSHLQLRYGVSASIREDPAAGYSPWQLLSIEKCLLPAVDSANVTQLVVNGTLDGVAADTGSQVGLDNLLVEGVLFLRDAFGPTLISAADALLSGPLRKKINAAIAEAVAQAHSSTAQCGSGISDGMAADGNEYQGVGSAGGVIALSFASCIALLLFLLLANFVLTWYRSRAGSVAQPRRSRRVKKPLSDTTGSAGPDKVGAEGGIAGDAAVGSAAPAAAEKGGVADGMAPPQKPVYASLASVCAPDPRLYVRSLALQTAVPLLLLAAMFLRTFSLSTSICKVHARLLVDGTVLLNELMINFSFSELVRDFFEAGAWLVSVLIIIGSAVMPCVNITGLLGLWWLPFGSAFRGRQLFLVNQSSKLSFIDVYFIAQMTYLFYDSERLGPATFELRSQPVLGIFAGMAGNCAQKLTGAYMLHLHRDLHPAGRGDLEHAHLLGESDGESVSQTVATTKGGGHNVRLSATATRQTNAVAAVLLFVSFATWVVSMVAPLIMFHVGGLLGDAQSDEDDQRKFTMWTIPSHLVGDTTAKVGAVFIIALFLVLVLVGPLVCYLAWALTWFAPLPMHVHRRCGAAAEHFFAWHGIDVLIVTLFAGWMEMNQIAVFLVKTTPLLKKSDELVKRLIGVDVIEMHGHWRWGSLCLLVCAISAAALFNLTYAQETVRQRMCNAERRRLRGLQRAAGRTEEKAEAYRAAAAAYDSDEAVSSSGRSTVIPRVAAQYCSIQ